LLANTFNLVVGGKAPPTTQPIENLIPQLHYITNGFMKLKLRFGFPFTPYPFPFVFFSLSSSRAA
jgi:hypothetical protein